MYNIMKRTFLRLLFITLITVFALTGCSSTPTVQKQSATNAQAKTKTDEAVYRVDCGAEAAYTDSEDNLWSADQKYTKGGWGYSGGSTEATTDTIADSKDGKLYQTVRYAEPVMNYKFTLPNGNYQVALKFNETGFDAIGSRLFNVSLEGSIYVYNMDLVAEAGKNKAFDKSFVMQVKDGLLNIGFNNLIDKASIAAISIIPTKAAPDAIPAPTPPPTPKQAAVTIDAGVKYQTIEGFGGFGAKQLWWGTKPFFDDEWNKMLIDDLGLTILRDHIPENFKLLDVKGKPYINLDEIAQGVDGRLKDHLPYLKAMKEAGMQKLIVTVWSPPSWMKTNDNVRGGGNLKPDFYDDYAQYLVDYVKLIKKECGIDVYALNVQNEPAFEEPYASCVYSPEQLRDLIKVVGPKFKAEGIKTKLFLPEDTGYYERVAKYINTVLDDEEARKYADIVAVHGYAFDGMTADSTDAKTWQDMYGAGAKYNKQLWMTETSGFPEGWEGGMKLAQAMYTALKYGKISAWVYWYTNGIVDTPQYYVSKNYYRYIRPGAVQLDSSSDNKDVLVLAFDHDADKTATIVLINSGNSEKTAKIGIKGGSLPETFKAYRTSASENCIKAGDVKVTDDIILPPGSITTLYGSK